MPLRAFSYCFGKVTRFRSLRVGETAAGTNVRISINSPLGLFRKLRSFSRQCTLNSPKGLFIFWSRDIMVHLEGLFTSRGAADAE